ncbi:MAG: ATP-binding protein [Candidatus Margulisbacteria bacterium]|nr:ATP-binding protein [Candidatus Margulisiibacteriota bacterium]
MPDLPFHILSAAKLKELQAAAKSAEEKLSETSQLLQAQQGISDAALHSMSEGVLAVDREGHIILANPAIEKMFNITEPEVVGKTVREGTRNNEIADIMETSLRDGRPISQEIDIVVPFQASLIVRTSLISDEEKNVLGAICVLHDITDIKKLENYRSEFVANVSHELKTPLTVIRNYVETLLNGAIEDKKHNIEFLEKINKHAASLSDLISDILELSQLETKKDLGAFAEVDLRNIMLKAIETIQPKAEKKKISISTNCGQSEHKVVGIEEHIYRAILNLLDNAVNYTGESGKIEISCRQEKGALSIIIADTGIGIPKEHQPRIFERFFRVDKARSRDLGGTGLGLAIVKHVMNLHNGSVTLESEEGKGARFTLVFPI